MPPKVNKTGDILKQLMPAYQPEINLYNQQLKQAPILEKQLRQSRDIARTNAFGTIREGANASGMLFSGIPIGEQAKYTGEVYLPTLAQDAANTRNQRFELQRALAGVNTNLRTQALAQRQAELDRYEAWRANQAQLAEARRAAASAGGGFGDLGSLLGGGTPAAQSEAAITDKERRNVLRNQAEQYAQRFANTGFNRNEYINRMTASLKKLKDPWQRYMVKSRIRALQALNLPTSAPGEQLRY